MKIKAEETFAIVIDYQEKILPAMSGQDELLRKSEILLGGLKALEVPMVLTTQYAKGLGDNVPAAAEEKTEFDVELTEAGAITEAMGVEEAIDKNTFSVYQNDQVRQAIPHGKKNVILCGIEAHICVLQSLIDLQEAGYQTILVADCVASRSDKDLAFAYERAKQEGAIITTAEAILYELAGSSKHPAFKTISALVK